MLRAKIDMASPNLVMRDPILYRDLDKVPHHRTGRDLVRLPDVRLRALPVGLDRGRSPTRSARSSSLDHRALYDWILDALEVPDCHPQQIEFARGNLSHTVMSKRVLRELVEDGHVRGWDDPRMPTLSRPAPARLPAGRDPALLGRRSASPSATT